jgi:hypothetical protein
LSQTEGEHPNVREISNEELTLADIPGPSADWDEVGAFALTSNGYGVWGSFEKRAEVAESPGRDSLTDLRRCLFFEQRRWRHFGYDPDETTMIHVREWIEQIRSRVAAGKAA